MSRPRNPARKNWPDNLYQNAAGYFSWRDPVSKKTHGLGRDRAYAFTEARAGNAKRAQDVSKSLVERIADGMTLNMWVDEWIEEVSKTVSAKTIKNHRSALRELQARCGHLPLRGITPKMVAEILKEVHDSGRERMAELIRDTAMELFRKAEQEGNIEMGKNPVAVTKAKGARVKRMRLTLEAFLKIHAATKTHWAKRALELALVSAQRRGDVKIAKRADVIDGHLQVDQMKSGGKTKLGIPLSLRLDAVGWSLKEIIDRCRTPGVISPHLIHHQTSGGHYSAGDPVTLNTISGAFATAVIDAKIVIEPGRTAPTFHEIRSLAIRLYKEQVSQDFAQTLAGHKDAKTTLLYTDPRDVEAKRIMIPDPKAKEFRTNID